MSERADTPANEDEPLFAPAEMRELEADDVTAGRALGKMLSIFFLYTIVAMSWATWWTWTSLD